MNDVSRIKGLLVLRVLHPDGYELEERYENVITNAGKAVLGTAPLFNYIALGTGITAELNTDTALEAEIADSGLSRAQDATAARTTTTVTDDTMVVEVAWTATAIKTFSEAGLFNAAAGPTMLAHKTFSAKNTVVGTVVTATWYIQFA